MHPTLAGIRGAMKINRVLWLLQATQGVHKSKLEYGEVVMGLFDLEPTNVHPTNRCYGLKGYEM
jgi:hypothetical protein